MSVPEGIFDGFLLWSFSKTGRKLGKHRTTIKRWVESGDLRVVRFKGRPDMIETQSIAELLSKNKQGAEAPIT
jgi:hypothetical protein